MLRGRSAQLEESFSDFREVDGLVIPHLIETQIKDRPEVINITVENVELDPELDDSRFHFPE
jgi:outer membrane lipoprotein-sorting protein